jgi:hypothetical protein
MPSVLSAICQVTPGLSVRPGTIRTNTRTFGTESEAWIIPASVGGQAPHTARTLGVSPWSNRTRGESEVQPFVERLWMEPRNLRGADSVD